jgi:hypothetical protein
MLQSSTTNPTTNVSWCLPAAACWVSGGAVQRNATRGLAANSAILPDVQASHTVEQEQNAPAMPAAKISFETVSVAGQGTSCCCVQQQWGPAQLVDLSIEVICADLLQVLFSTQAAAQHIQEPGLYGC